MCFRYSQDEVLKTTREMLMAWQNKQFDWTDDWSAIDDRLKGYRQRFAQSAQPHTHIKGALASGSKGGGGTTGGGAGNGGNPKKQQKPQGKPDVNGVPKSFMKANNVCIRFNNKDGCKEKASHTNRYSEDKAVLRHICAGCFAKDKSEQQHRVFDCRKHNFSALFRRW